MATEPLGLYPPVLLPVLDLIRGIPAGLLRQVRVTRKSWQWTGTDGSHRVNHGRPIPLPDLEIGPKVPWSGAVGPPHVIGTSGDVEVDIINLNPAYFENGVQVGGYSPDDLNVLDGTPPGVEWQYILQWPQGPRRYVLAPRGFTTSASLHYNIHLVATERVVPF